MYIIRSQIPIFALTCLLFYTSCSDLAAIYWFDKATDSKSTNDKIKYYTKAIELDPDYSDAYHNRGLAYAKNGLWDKAVQDYTKALEITPNDPDCYNNRGAVYRKKGSYDKAISDFKKCIELDTGNVIYDYNLGLVYSDKGDHNAALARFYLVVERNPTFADGWFSRGMLFYNKGDFYNGCHDLNMYLKINGNKNGDAEKIRKMIRERGYTPKY